MYRCKIKVCKGEVFLCACLTASNAMSVVCMGPVTTVQHCYISFVVLLIFQNYDTLSISASSSNMPRLKSREVDWSKRCKLNESYSFNNDSVIP